MNCEICGNEMLLERLTAFFTEYVCPVCGNAKLFSPSADAEEEIFDYKPMRVECLNCGRWFISREPGDSLLCPDCRNKEV